MAGTLSGILLRMLEQVFQSHVAPVEAKSELLSQAGQGSVKVGG